MHGVKGISFKRYILGDVHTNKTSLTRIRSHSRPSGCPQHKVYHSSLVIVHVLILVAVLVSLCIRSNGHDLALTLLWPCWGLAALRRWSDLDVKNLIVPHKVSGGEDCQTLQDHVFHIFTNFVKWNTLPSIAMPSVTTMWEWITAVTHDWLHFVLGDLSPHADISLHDENLWQGRHLSLSV